MQLIEDYLRRDLGRNDLVSWEAIRVAYMERAVTIVKKDWQSPAYLTSLENQAGRREGKIVGNINDYTRDKHDLALAYEKKFAKEYLSGLSFLPIEPYITSSGMAALTTIVLTIHRECGGNQTILVGKHSYFQNLELLTKSFNKVILFDENKLDEWQRLIVEERPRAIFVDTMCNEADLTVPPVIALAKYLEREVSEKTYLVVDNSMLAIGYPWRDLFKHCTKNLEIIGWESLNKYYQFGLDRTTGGVLWGSRRMSLALFYGRLHGGTIMPDINAAMLPTPSKRILTKYMQRVEQNRRLLQNIFGARGISAQTEYWFSGAQVVVLFDKKQSYFRLQRIIKVAIGKARREGLQLSAGTSFGMPSTRVYITAADTKYAKYTSMFLRISVGVEEKEVIEKIGRILLDSI